MKLNKNGRSIIISDTSAQYAHDIDTYFDKYFDAIDTQANILDFSAPTKFKMRGWYFDVWLPSFTESISELSKYTEYCDIPEGGIVIDAGAYAGLASMIFADLVGPQGKVIAVESDQINIECIRKNFSEYYSRRNYVPEIVQAALWDSDGYIEFSSEGAMGSSAIEYVGSRGLRSTVQSITLSSLAANLERVDHVKMDIEGAEIRVVNDASFFEKYSPSLTIECHPINGSTKNYILPILDSYGYSCDIIGQQESGYEMLVCRK